jgi:tRNA(Phe) wybutosine-synthesizing methylase Tyw3
MNSGDTEQISAGMVNPAIFEHLQAKIDEDSSVREELRNLLQTLEKQGVTNNIMPLLAFTNSRRENITVHIVSCSRNTCSAT